MSVAAVDLERLSKGAAATDPPRRTDGSQPVGTPAASSFALRVAAPDSPLERAADEVRAGTGATQTAASPAAARERARRAGLAGPAAR